VRVGEDERALVLVHSRTGEIAELTGTPCLHWGFSMSGDRFLYGVCSGSLRGGDARTELRIRELASGVEQTFAVLEGYEGSRLSAEAMLSPDGDAVLIYARHGFRSNWATHLVARGGGVRPLAEGFAPLAWRTGREAVLTAVVGEPGLLLVDVESGETTVVFP
jgi:hypothetical protein